MLLNAIQTYKEDDVDLASLLRSDRRIVDEEKTYIIEMGISRI
jgi:hypothetical protein